jgi:uncharacterized Zn finger protein
MARNRRFDRPRGERRPHFWGNSPPRSVPLAAEGGIKAESRQGDFGSSWWARRWQAVLDSFRLGGRLARGRSYARQGQVLKIDISLGKVTAEVQGSRPKPYTVSLSVKPLSEQQWEDVILALSKQAIYVAKLLAGEMPDDIEKVFQQAGLTLFPEKRGDLRTDCSCPDDANPCKHIAAVYYLLGEEFDRDPFLLFRLRGLEREALVRMLGPGKAQEAAPKTEIPAEPLPANPAEFWELGAVTDDVYGEAQTPPVTAALVRRLGKFPFWRGEKPLLEAVEAAYVDASAAGIKAFLGEKLEHKGK